METFWELIKNAHIQGFTIGIAIAFFIWKSGVVAKRTLKKENKRLQSEMRELETHLNTQLKINASGNNLSLIHI